MPGIKRPSCGKNGGGDRIGVWGLGGNVIFRVWDPVRILSPPHQIPAVHWEAPFQDPCGCLGSFRLCQAAHAFRERVPSTGGALLSALHSQRPPQLGPFCRAAIFFKNKKGREGGGRKKNNVRSLPPA